MAYVSTIENDRTPVRTRPAYVSAKLLALSGTGNPNAKELTI